MISKDISGKNPSKALGRIQFMHKFQKALLQVGTSKRTHAEISDATPGRIPQQFGDFRLCSLQCAIPKGFRKQKIPEETL